MKPIRTEHNKTLINHMIQSGIKMALSDLLILFIVQEKHNFWN